MNQNRPKSLASAAMTGAEKRAATSLAAIIALRMLGLFMILPVFSLYAEHLHGVTPLLIGVALGAYGLTQATFQIPFGMLSDRIGRKPVITAGLLVFAAGSAIAASADGIWGVIVGRTLQGAGAISAASMALAADLTREEQRTKAMAIIGASIGLSFGLAMVAGPVLGNLIGVPGIFWFTAALALAGVALLHLGLPGAERLKVRRDAESVPGQFGRVLRNPDLLRLDFGILTLHTAIMSGFVVLPLMIRDAGLPPPDHWMVYLGAMLLSLPAMLPFLFLAERRRRVKEVFLGAIAALALMQFALAGLPVHLTGLIALLVAWFAAFNLLEAKLPSLVSRTAPADCRGTALGVYSSSQFLGAFLGGACGGWIHGAWGAQAVFWFAGALSLAWLAVAAPMRRPRYLSNHMIFVGQVTDEKARALDTELRRVPGVEEARVVAEDGVAYLKVERHTLDAEALHLFSAAGDGNTGNGA